MSCGRDTEDTDVKYRERFESILQSADLADQRICRVPWPSWPATIRRTLRGTYLIADGDIVGDTG